MEEIMCKQNKLIFLDNYEKHLLENGFIVPYLLTTVEQREKDYVELIKVINSKGGNHE
jgi:hypothetical protein